jgi:hypothetical protein
LASSIGTLNVTGQDHLRLVWRDWDEPRSDAHDFKITDSEGYSIGAFDSELLAAIS